MYLLNIYRYLREHWEGCRPVAMLCRVKRNDVASRVGIADQGPSLLEWNAAGRQTRWECRSVATCFIRRNVVMWQPGRGCKSVVRLCCTKERGDVASRVGVRSGAVPCLMKRGAAG